MNTTIVSVLMPVYNAERYVAEAVESVLTQTFTNFEFLIIDDGSTDGSLAILQKYAARDPRIRLISRPNTGYVVALNEMLALARGKYIARMDADDICLPERFEKQVTFLDAHPEHVAVGTLVSLIDADGDALCDFHDLISHDQIDQAHLRGAGGMLCHPTLMCLTESLNRLNGYRLEYYPAEDLDLMLRLAENGRIANIPEIQLKYRRHLEATGHQFHVRQVEAKQRAIQDALTRRSLHAQTAEHAVEERPISVSSQLRMWSWWALNAGNTATARKHARKALWLEPWSPESWKVLYCAYRGR